MTVYDRSVREVACETFENVLGRDFAADGPWQKMGTDVTEFRCSFDKANLAPVYDFGSKEIATHSISVHPDLAQQEEMLGMLLAAKPEGVAHPALGYGLAVPTCGVRRRAGGERLRPEHVAQGQLHRQRRDGAGLRPHQGRVLPRARLGCVRGAQARPRGLHPPLEPREAPDQAEGPDPGGVPGAGPSGGRVSVML